MKVFIASIADLQKLVEKRKTIPYVLESFYYFKDWQHKYLSDCKMFLLDSGAFTFVNKGETTDWVKFTDKLADFIKSFDIKYFFEMDIDTIIGVKEARKLRDRLESRTQKQSIPVWHTIRGKQAWIDMVKDYDYVSTSLSGFTITSKWFKKHKHKPLHWFFEHSQKNNCKVHGLGCTAMPILKQFPFYSVDSTAWKHGGISASVFHFDGHEMKAMRDKERRSKHYMILHEHNLTEWLKFQNYAYENL